MSRQPRTPLIAVRDSEGRHQVRPRRDDKGLGYSRSIDNGTKKTPVPDGVEGYALTGRTSKAGGRRG